MKMKVSLAFILAFIFFIHPLSAQTWSSTKRLTWNSGNSMIPAISVDSSDNLHMVWEDWSSGDPEIYYKKSSDGGSTWSIKRLTWTSGNSYDPAISVDSSDNLHVVWYDSAPGNYEIFYKKSTDGGVHWTTKRLTWNSAHSNKPDVATDPNGHIHVAWYEMAGIFHKKSTDGGTTWTTKRLTWNPSSTWSPSIATNSVNHIYVAYTDSSFGNTEIFYKKSTDGGASWTTKRLTWSSGSSYSPQLAFDSSDNLQVVWSDDSHGDMEIYFKRSTDGGTTWAMHRITCGLGESYFPSITTDSSDNIHVVWGDDFPGEDEIYYTRSTDGGVIWTIKRLTWNPGSSDNPGIATDSSDNIFVVWEDNTTGSNEIYLRKGIQ